MQHPRKHPSNKLLRLRKTFGFTQKDIMAALSLRDAGRISQWENGRRLPSLKKAILLSVLYKSLVDDVFYGLREEAVREIAHTLKKLEKREQQSLPKKPP